MSVAAEQSTLGVTVWAWAAAGNASTTAKAATVFRTTFMVPPADG
jgi:hypothetical protein